MFSLQLMVARTARVRWRCERFVGSALRPPRAHRAPATAKTQLIGDEILARVMGGVYTEVEKTMIELERNASVMATRSAFQHAMKDRFIAVVERLSGRSVHAFISDSHVGPDLQIELFILEPAPEPIDPTDVSAASR